MNLSFRTKNAETQSAIPTPRPPFIIESFGLSDRGQVRKLNEDCFVAAELTRTLRVHHTNLAQTEAASSINRGYVLLVADGVGGHNAGEVASGLSVKSIEGVLLNTLKRFSNLQSTEEHAVLLDLQKALFQADARIFEEATTHPEWQGMATTLTLAFACNWRLFVAHAGDSRCYLYMGKKLQQLTQDHTMTAEMARHGVIQPQSQGSHPWRHIATNILGGAKPGVQVQLNSLDLHAGDVLLLCSDGLTEMVPEDEIASILEEDANSPQRACEELVSVANNRGGTDDITSIVAHVKAGGVMSQCTSPWGASRDPNYLSSDVQCPQRVALIGMLIWQYGQSFVVGAAATTGFFSRFIALMTTKMAKATIRKSITVLMNTPYLIATAGESPDASLIMRARLEKSTLPNSTPMGGITTSATNDETILPNAAPMMMPTAMSTTLPFIAKSLNSLSRV
jgi:PPM family protein phosphatase